MDEQLQIESSKDKTFEAFLWLLSIVSLYNLYATTSLFQQLRLLKGIMGLVMIAAEVLLVVMAIRTYREQSTSISHFLSLLLFITLLYNMAHIVYGMIWDADTVYLSFFGNPIYQPAFMLPFVVGLGLDGDRLFPMIKCILYYTLLIIPIFVVSQYMNVFVGMGLIFLLAFIRYMPRGWRWFLMTFAVIYVVYSYYDDARAPILRVLMGGAIMFFSLTPLYKSNVVKITLFVIAISVPLYFLALFVRTGYSVFEESATSSRVSELGAADTGDTRTFLYEEVFDDLTDNNAWVLGKGINGKYYSWYFDRKIVNSNEDANRVLVEVGILDSLLKGGLVQTILYLLLLSIAIFNCFFQSNSRVMVLVGLILLTHYIFLFIEDVPRFDLFNVCMWFCIGMSFSYDILDRNEQYFIERFLQMF